MIYRGRRWLVRSQAGRTARLAGKLATVRRCPAATRVPSPSMTDNPAWRPRHDDPLFILAMDHRESFGRTLFEVKDDDPDHAQPAAIRSAKRLIFDGLLAAPAAVTTGRAGVLVDERYGQDVIERSAKAGRRSCWRCRSKPAGTTGSRSNGAISGWSMSRRSSPTTPRSSSATTRISTRAGVRPSSPASRRSRRAAAGVPLLYELLVPATDAQLAQVGR